MVAASLVVLVLFAPPSYAQAFSGRVIGPGGKPIQGAQLTMSGLGLAGWTESAGDGSFAFQQSGAFLSVRHAGFIPRLLRVADVQTPVQIELATSRGSSWKVPPCGRKKVFGGGLAVSAPQSRTDGPTHGDHVSHWYVHYNADHFLHVLAGQAVHSGLPREDLLLRSNSIEMREWTDGKSGGLDLSGMTEGGRWRWVGGSVTELISYENATPKAAAWFDRIIRTACQLR